MDYKKLPLTKLKEYAINLGYIEKNKILKMTKKEIIKRIEENIKETPIIDEKSLKEDGERSMDATLSSVGTKYGKIQEEKQEETQEDLRSIKKSHEALDFLNFVGEESMEIQEELK